MPYLLQNSQNRVENIKKKFENFDIDGKEGIDSFKNCKTSSTPSKTKVIHVLRSGNTENDFVNNGKYQLTNALISSKSELTKSDNKAVVRRSPAFRREKLFFSKSEGNFCNTKDSAANEERKSQSSNRGQPNKINVTESASALKLKHDNAPSNFSLTCIESNAIKFSTNNKSKNDNLTSLAVKVSDVAIQEHKTHKNVINDNIVVQCSDGDKSPTDKLCTSKSKNELKLTDSIRLALKSPLPKGPPPKKPPRTFMHLTKNVSAEKDISVGVSGKDDPNLRLKLEKIEKVVKVLDSRTHANTQWENGRLELNKHLLDVLNANNSCPQSSQGLYGKPTDIFCLKNLNCLTADSCEKPVTFGKESERQSSFYINHQNCGKDCNETDVKNSSLSASSTQFALSRSPALRLKSEPIYDLPCVSKKSSFQSFGKASKETGNGLRGPPQLHYMCTDVVNSLQEELRPSKFTPLPQSKPVTGFQTEASQNKKLGFRNSVIKKTCPESTVNSCKFETQSKRKENASKMEVDSDSESGSSGLDELLSDPAENGKPYNSDLSRISSVPSAVKENDNLTNASALRKIYAKKVSSKLLNNPLFTKTLNNESLLHLFESCILVGLTLGELKTTVPYIKSIFPPNVKPPPLIEFLCFPDASTWSHSSHNLQQGEQYYSLVITSENGDRKFGYCRRVLPEGGNFCLPLVYCIISPHRANGFYYKVLQELESRHGSSELQDFIKQLYECNFPGPGQSLKFKKILEEVTRVSPVKVKESLPSTIVRRPCDVRLEDRDLSQLLQHLKISVLLKVFSSLLLERKVLLLSNSLRNLSSCVEALQSLLIPFSWQHTFIPVLPNHLTEMCDAPTPYIIGLQKCGNTTDLLVTLQFEEGIMIDLEESLVIMCCGDEGSIIPEHLIRGLKTALNLVLSSSLYSDNDRNVLISEVFIRFFVAVCGNYSYFLVRQADGKKVFQKEEFVSSAKPANQPFLDWFVETAMFRSFVQERLQHDVEDLFKRRAIESLHETDKSGDLLLKNCKGMNKKVKTLGDKIKDLSLFSK